MNTFLVRFSHGLAYFTNILPWKIQAASNSSNFANDVRFWTGHNETIQNIEKLCIIRQKNVIKTFSFYEKSRTEIYFKRKLRNSMWKSDALTKIGSQEYDYLNCSNLK